MFKVYEKLSKKQKQELVDILIDKDLETIQVRINYKIHKTIDVDLSSGKCIIKNDLRHKNLRLRLHKMDKKFEIHNPTKARLMLLIASSAYFIDEILSHFRVFTNPNNGIVDIYHLKKEKWELAMTL